MSVCVCVCALICIFHSYLLSQGAEMFQSAVISPSPILVGISWAQFLWRQINSHWVNLTANFLLIRAYKNSRVTAFNIQTETGWLNTESMLPH